jgi:hypothetical protein
VQRPLPPVVKAEKLLTKKAPHMNLAEKKLLQREEKADKQVVLVVNPHVCKHQQIQAKCQLATPNMARKY